MNEHKKKLLRKNIHGKRNILLITAGIILVFLDQLFKRHLMTNSYYNSLFSLHFVKNTGISFGLLPGTAAIMIVISILFILLIWWFREEFHDCMFCLILITAGTFGNLIDRILLGYVVDYFDLGWFPVFNLADAMISLGVAGMIGIYIYQIAKERKKHSGKDS